MPGKEDAMATMRTLPGAVARSIGSGVFDAPGGRSSGRIFLTLRKLWLDIVALPDRGAAATPDDLPPEFYRFPPV
jgi:hypothetical protein